MAKTVKKQKKDFDKELMYSKIMPSVSAYPDEGKEEPALPRPEPSVPAPPRPEPSAPAQPPPTGAPRYILRNYIEDIVLERLARTMQMLKACECEKCKKDAMAIALNAVPPCYIAVENGREEETVRELRAQHEVRVMGALIQAIQTVKANPAHDHAKR